MPLSRSAVRTLLPACVALVSCGREATTGPRFDSRDASSLVAKPAPALAVTSTNPPYGEVGKTVDVHVFGSGFTPGAQANWLLHGSADARVRTNNTTYVSSTELVANVTIASDAQLALWDVQVALLGGKNGVGSEAFEVTSAQILGDGTLGGDAINNDMNDQGQVVGYSTGGAITAFAYDESLGMVNLGGGQAWAIDPLGTIVLGRNANFFATAWVRQPDNRWLAELLPTSAGLGGNGAGAARGDDGTLIVAGWEGVASGKKGSVNRPVLWRRVGSAWTAPIPLTLPPGAASSSAQDVNHLGQAVGAVDGASNLGAVWDTPSTVVRLDGSASAINEAGNLIVGRRNSVPVYWWRTSNGTWTTVGVPLPTIAGASCTSGSARAVNSDGVIVGDSCNAGGRIQATMWVVDLSSGSPQLIGAPRGLPGLGPNKTASESSSATGVTESFPYVASGGALLTGTRLAVRWRLP